MKTANRSLRVLLLTGAALFAASAALAQETAPAPSTPPETEEPQEEATEVDEVVVIGRFIPEPIRNTPEVANFVTTEDLQRTGDDNAAQALTRVAGLSLVSGRFVYVRGLGERYSQALLNGSPLPSPEPTQRVVPLDLFPASVLAGAAVQKTFSANYPAEFGGGVVDIRTVSAPRDPFVSLGVSLGYLAGTTNKKGLTYYGSDTDALGFDDGERNLPAYLRVLGANRQVVNTGNPGSLTNADIQAIARDFSNSNLNVIQRSRTPVNGSIDLSAGQTVETSYGDIGMIGVLGYRSAWQTRRGVRQVTTPDVGGLALLIDSNFETNQNDVGWNFLGGLAWDKDDHEVRLNQLWIRSTSKRARITGNTARSQRNPQQNTYNTEWFERELFLTQLAGRSDFGDVRLDWRGTVGETTRDAPYERLYRYAPDGTGRQRALLTGANQLVSFSTLKEDIASFNADVTWRLPVSFVRRADLKLGYAWQNNDRTATRRDFTYTQGRNWDPSRYAYERIDYLVSDRNINDEIVELRELTGAALTGYAPRYDADLTVNAAYVQVESEIVPLVRASFGLRYEDAEEGIRTFDIFANTGTPLFTRKLNEAYVLPTATLTWNFAEDQQLRFGVSKTIGRPQFRELAPQPYLDPDSDRSFRGNSFLVDTEFKNVDLRYEAYFARNQFLTIGAFYKSIDKPVEALADFGSEGTIRQTFFNAPRARLYGVELDFRKYFEPEFITSFSPGGRLFVASNYTYSKSELLLNSTDRITLEGSAGAPSVQLASGYVRGGERLQGQSEHLANLQFGLEDDDAGTQATFLVTYTSERVAARGSGDNPDLLQEPGVRLDFVVRQDFTVSGRPLTFGFEARNLTRENSEEFQEARNGRFNTNTFDLGSSISFSLSSRF